MTNSAEQAMERNDFHVLQTYDELSSMIYEAVLYEVAHAQEGFSPSKAEVEYANQVAQKVRDGVMCHVDAIDVPRSSLPPEPLRGAKGESPEEYVARLRRETPEDSQYLAVLERHLAESCRVNLGLAARESCAESLTPAAQMAEPDPIPPIHPLAGESLHELAARIIALLDRQNDLLEHIRTELQEWPRG